MSRNMQRHSMPAEYGLVLSGGKWKSRIICVLAEKKAPAQCLCVEIWQHLGCHFIATLKELIADQSGGA